MRDRGDILDEGTHYRLRSVKGPFIRKSQGRGKVLTHLLQNPGKRVSLNEMVELTGWREARREMSSLTFQINAWSKDYKIIIEGEGRAPHYRLVRVDEQETYNPKH